MHFLETLDKHAKPPGLKGEFHPGLVACTARIEVWGTSITDPGPDLCEFRLVSHSGEVLEKLKMRGY